MNRDAVEHIGLTKPLLVASGDVWLEGEVMSVSYQFDGQRPFTTVQLGRLATISCGGGKWSRFCRRVRLAARVLCCKEVVR